MRKSVTACKIAIVQLRTKIKYSDNIYLSIPNAMQYGHGAFTSLSALQTSTILFNFMTSRQAKIQEDTYFRVMSILQENPDLTQRELANKLGVSVSGLNYCLKALTEKGWVKMQNFNYSKNKFGYIYLLTPKGIAEKAALTSRFLKRKMEEYDALKAEIDTLKLETAKHESSTGQKGPQ